MPQISGKIVTNEFDSNIYAVRQPAERPGDEQGVNQAAWDDAVASFSTSLLDGPPTTHESGVLSLPGGRGPGGKRGLPSGIFLRVRTHGKNQVNILDQYSNVILSRK